MKKRLCAWFLAAAIVISATPMTMAISDPVSRTSGTSDSTFLEDVVYPLPQMDTSGPINPVTLPVAGPDGFIGEVPLPPQEIRTDGFLTVPSKALPEIPGKGTLMEKPAPPDPNAIPIDSVETLESLREQMKDGGSYVLTADLDFTGIDWKPIQVSLYQNRPASLILDGQGHKLTGLKFNQTGSFFSGCADRTEVRNLVFDETTVTTFDGSSYYGGSLFDNLVCKTIVIENCTVTRQFVFNETNYKTFFGIGGISRNMEADSITIRACSVDMTLDAGDNIPPDDSPISTFRSIGGLCSAFTCYNTALLQDLCIRIHANTTLGTKQVCGLFQEVKSNLGNTTVERCRVELLNPKDKPMPMMGFCHRIPVGGNLTIRDSQFDCGQACLVSSLLIDNIKDANLTMDNVRCDGNLQAGTGILPDSDTGSHGLIGRISHSGTRNTLTLCHVLNTAHIILTDPERPVNDTVCIGGLVGSCTANFIADSCLNLGNVSSLETTEGQAPFVNYAGGLAGWIHTESKDTGEVSVKLTGCENRGAIYGDNAGGLAASILVRGTPRYEGCKNTGEIRCYRGFGRSGCAGGLFGIAGGTMIGCLNTSTVLGKDTAGGLVCISGETPEKEDLPLTMDRCRNTGRISASSAGGLIGVSSSAILTNCLGDGEIDTAEQGSSLTGILAGECDTIKNCAGEGTLTISHGHAGGLAGRCNMLENSYANVAIRYVGSSTHPDYLGGLAGECGIIHNCWTVADIDVPSGFYLGGLAGACGSIISSWATGTIRCGSSTYVGGLAGSARTIGQSWADTHLVGGRKIGGLVGTVRGGGFLYSCQSAAQFEPDSKAIALGGLVGSFNDPAEKVEPLKLRDCRYEGFKLQADIPNVGGLVGTCEWDYASQLFFENCYVTGSITNVPEPAPSLHEWGGLSGIGGNCSNCFFDGTISSGNSTVGGLIGSNGNRFNDCYVKGTVSGNIAGGIAGEANLLQDCVSEATVTAHPENTITNFYQPYHLGGLAGDGVRLYNCQAIKPVRITLDLTSNSQSSVYIGGASGYSYDVSGGKNEFVNVTTAGVHAVISNVLSATIGGIAGSTIKGALDHCTVAGDVTGIMTPSSNADNNEDYYLSLGGAVGSDGSDNYMPMAYVTIKGDIRTENHFPKPVSTYVKTGGLLGAGDLFVEHCTLEGTTTFPEQYESLHVHPFLGSGDIKTTEIPPLDIPPREKETYRIYAQSIELSDGAFHYQPLGGSTIYIDDVKAGTTGPDGTLTLTNESLKTAKLVEIRAEKQGFFGGSNVTLMADGGDITLTLKQKTPGEIYFRSVILSGTDKFPSSDLLGPNQIYIPQRSDAARDVTPRVDWNDLDPQGRKLWLVNSDETKQVRLHTDTGTPVVFPQEFDVHESIYLLAKGTYQGKAVTKKQKLNVMVNPYFPRLDSPEVSKSMGSKKLDGLYFLDGLDLNLGLGDITDLGAEVSFKNGMCTVKYDGKKAAQAKSTFKGKFGQGEKCTQSVVRLEGIVRAPFTPTQEGPWSGSVSAGFNDGFDLETDTLATVKASHGSSDSSIFSMNYQCLLPVPGLPSVPCFIETSLGAGVQAKLGFTGDLDNALATGSVTGMGYGSIFGGLGGEVADKNELKFGAEGELLGSGTVMYNWDYGSKEPAPKHDLEGDFKGKLNVKASYKACIIEDVLDQEIEAKITLGHFHWNSKDGTDWSLFGIGNQTTPTLLSSGVWRPMTREYLKNGGGFVSGDIPSLMSFQSGADQVRYANIGDASEAVMATGKFGTYLFFTADDGSSAGPDAPVYQHTALYRSSLENDGTWSAPVRISKDGTYPCGLYSDGSYVVWVESTKTGSLDELVTSTELRLCPIGVSPRTSAPAIDPNLIITVPTKSGNIHNARVSTDKSWMNECKALLCWYDNQDEIHTIHISLDPANNYAHTFSPASDLKTVGNPSSVYPYYNAERSTTEFPYLNDQGDFYFKGSKCGSGFRRLGCQSTAFVAVDANKRFHYLDKDGTEDSAKSWNAPAYTETQSPILLNEYAVWPEGGGIGYRYIDSKSTFFIPTTGTPQNISVCTNSGGLVLSYYLMNAETGTYDLHTAQVVRDSRDLVINDVSLDPDQCQELGAAMINASLYNNSSHVKKLQVTLTDKDGKTLYDQVVNQPVNAGGTTEISIPFAPTTADYTLEVMPLSNKGDPINELDSRDNQATLTLPYDRAILKDLSFQPDPAKGTDAVQLHAVAQNTGINDLGNLSFRITPEGGEAQVITDLGTANAIPCGSMRQAVIRDIIPDIPYTVEVLLGDKVVDSSMAVYTVPGKELLSLTSISVTGSNKVTAQLTGENILYPEMPVLALYDGGKMISMSCLDPVDLNGSVSLSFDITVEPSQKDLQYALFFLKDEKNWVPSRAAMRGTLNP